MNWFERYSAALRSLEVNNDSFVEELQVAAEEFLVQGFRAELELWTMTDPDDLLGR